MFLFFGTLLIRRSVIFVKRADVLNNVTLTCILVNIHVVCVSNKF